MNTLHTPESSEDDLHRRARKRVEMRMAFYTHLLVYLCVNGGLMLLGWLQGSPRWTVWPLFGWGIGLAIHGLVTFIALRGEGVRERLLAREIEHLRSRAR